MIETVLASGEGPSDLGQQYADKITYGPVAVLLQQLGIPLSPQSRWIFCGKEELKQHSRLQLPGKKRRPGQAYFHSNALGLGRMASRHRGNTVAILFRDGDRTRQTPRDEWQEKWNSIQSGFEEAEFSNWVGLLPAPKSEAWLLCALKESPYEHCAVLEELSGNDASPKSLKKRLVEAAKGRGICIDAASLVEWLQNSAGDAAEKIDMNSWNQGRARVNCVVQRFDQTWKTDHPR